MCRNLRTALVFFLLYRRISRWRTIGKPLIKIISILSPDLRHIMHVFIMLNYLKIEDDPVILEYQEAAHGSRQKVPIIECALNIKVCIVVFQPPFPVNSRCMI